MTRDRIENTLRAENNRGIHRPAVSVFAAFRKTAEKLKLLVEQEGNGPIDQRATRAEKTTSEIICPNI